MSEIRVLTAAGQTVVVTAEKFQPGREVKDLAEEIYRDGLRVTNETGGSIMRVMAVEYTEGSFSKIVKPQIVRPN